MKLKSFCIYIFILIFLNACSNGGAYDTGSIEGTIYDSTNGLPVQGAMITIGGNSFLTDQNGSYFSSEINVGRKTISAVNTGYDSFSGTVDIKTETTTTYDINLIRSNIVLTDKTPAAHYTLNAITADNYVTDSSANHIDGAVAGDTSIVEGPGGKLTNAVHFDGDGDYIECPPNPAITDYNMTVSFWAKYNNAEAYTLSFHNSEAIRGFRIIFHDGKVAISYYHSGTSVYIHLSPPGNTLPEDEWCHITVVIDEEPGDFGFIKPYINGEHIAVRDHYLEGAINDMDSCSLFLGSSNRNAYWRGDLADVRVYTETLTAEEISALYNIVGE